MSIPNEVSVNVNDLIDLADWYANDPISRSWAIRLIDAIPEPEWEPREDQLAAFADTFGYHLPGQRPAVAGYLKRLVKNGLVLP